MQFKTNAVSFTEAVGAFYATRACVVVTDHQNNFVDCVRAYAVAALWSSFDDSNVVQNPDVDTSAPDYEANDTSLDDMGFALDNIAPATVQKFCDNCWAFIHDDTKRYYDVCAFESRNDWRQIGHSFWLNHNGHGSGFFDFTSSEPTICGWDDLCDRLSDACEGFNDVELYVHDGQIHHT